MRISKMGTLALVAFVATMTMWSPESAIAQDDTSKQTSDLRAAVERLQHLRQEQQEQQAQEQRATEQSKQSSDSTEDLSYYRDYYGKRTTMSVEEQRIRRRQAWAKKFDHEYDNLPQIQAIQNANPLAEYQAGWKQWDAETTNKMKDARKDFENIMKRLDPAQVAEAKQILLTWIDVKVDEEHHVVNDLRRSTLGDQDKADLIAWVERWRDYKPDERAWLREGVKSFQ